MLGHLVVLVLRRDLPGPTAGVHPARARRRRARVHAAAGAVLDRHRRRLAAVRAAVGPQGRDRPRAVRLDRPDAVRDRPVARVARNERVADTSGVAAFLAVSAHWRVAVDIVLLGVFGGFYTVPLYALIQSRSQPSHRSRIIAANNILNALFIVVSALRRHRPAAGGRVDPAALPRRRRDERARRRVHLLARARVPDALSRVAARAHVLSRAVRRDSRTSRTKGRASSCAIT